MVSTERIKDFTAFDENPYVGMLNPVSFNDTGDDGSGYPGLQRAIFNRFTWWLHSGNMDSGLHIAGYDITGVNLLYVNQISTDIQTNDLTGNLNNISGYESVSANTGIFQDIKGFSDINMQDSLDFGGSYHLKDVSQITGSLIRVGTAGGLTVGTRTLTDDEWTQLTNIGSSAISSTEWGYVAAMQSVSTSASPTFVGLTLSSSLDMGAAAITNVGNVDGVDISTFKSTFNTHTGTTNAHISNLNQIPTRNHDDLASKDGNSSYLHSTSAEQTNWNAAVSHVSANGSSHSYINQSVTSSASPTFAGMTFGNGNYVNFSAGIYLKELNYSQYLVLTYQVGDTTQLCIYQSSASTSDERGNLGMAGGGTASPFERIYSHEVFTDDGTVSSYSHVDDLQLLREVKEWDVREKITSSMFPNEKGKVFDKETLPWIKAHKGINGLAIDNNDKRYASSTNSKVGYLLSTLQKMLERQDKLISQLNELGISVDF